MIQPPAQQLAPAREMKVKKFFGPVFEGTLTPFAPRPPLPPLPFPAPASERRSPKVFPSPELLARIIAVVGPPSAEELKVLREAQAEVRRLQQEENRFGIDGVTRAFRLQRVLAEEAVARGERPPDARTLDQIHNDFLTKRTACHSARVRLMERTWAETCVPLLKRFFDGAQSLIPELEKMGSKVSGELGIENPASNAVTAIRDLGAYLSWNAGPLMNLESLPFVGQFLK